MKYLVTVIALLVTPALAQQQNIEQRIGAQLGALVIQNASLTMQIEQLQVTLKAAQDRVKTLEDKYEPKKSEEKK